MNPIRRTNLHSNVEDVTLSTLRTLLYNLRWWSCAFDICLANIFLKSFTNVFCLILSFFTWNISKHLLFFVVKGILVDIGCNLWHSLVLQSQIRNFPYTLKKSVSCVKLFSLNNFTLSLHEAPKAHYFCFLLLIQRSAVQQKSNAATLPDTKCFFYCKTHVLRTIAMFIVSQ